MHAAMPNSEQSSKCDDSF